MARIRTIKPEFWDDENVGKLSLGARLLFIGTWNLADDEGFIKWNGNYLKSKIFVYDDPRTVRINTYMEELVTGGFIVTDPQVLADFAENMQDRNADVVGKVRSWGNHQVISHPKRSMHPQSVKDRIESKCLEISRKRSGMVMEHSRPEGEGKGTGKGKEEEGLNGTGAGKPVNSLENKPEIIQPLKKEPVLYFAS